MFFSPTKFTGDEVKVGNKQEEINKSNGTNPFSSPIFPPSSPSTSFSGDSSIIGDSCRGSPRQVKTGRRTYGRFSASSKISTPVDPISSSPTKLLDAFKVRIESTDSESLAGSMVSQVDSSPNKSKPNEVPTTPITSSPKKRSKSSPSTTPTKRKIYFAIPELSVDELNTHFVEPKSSNILNQKKEKSQKPEQEGLFAIFNFIDPEKSMKSTKVLKTRSMLDNKTSENNELNPLDIGINSDLKTTFELLERQNKTNTTITGSQDLELSTTSASHPSSQQLQITQKYIRTYSQTRSYQYGGSTEFSSDTESSYGSDNEEIDTTSTKLTKVSTQNNESVGVHSNQKGLVSIYELRAKSFTGYELNDDISFYFDPFMSNGKLSVMRSSFINLLLKLDESPSMLQGYPEIIENETIITQVLSSCHSQNDPLLNYCFVQVLREVLKIKDSKLIGKLAQTLLLNNKENFQSMLLSLCEYKSDSFDQSNMSKFDKINFNKWISLSEQKRKSLALSDEVYITPKNASALLIGDLLLGNQAELVTAFLNDKLIEHFVLQFISNLEESPFVFNVAYFKILELVIDKVSLEDTQTIIESFKDLFILSNSTQLHTSIIMILLVIDSSDSLIDSSLANALFKSLQSNTMSIIRGNKNRTHDQYKNGNELQNSTSAELLLLVLAFLIQCKKPVAQLISESIKRELLHTFDLLSTDLPVHVNSENSKETASDSTLIYVKGYFSLLISSIFNILKSDITQTRKFKLLDNLENFSVELMKNMNDFNTSMIDNINNEIKKLASF